MSRIGNIEKKTNTHFLNFYEFEAIHWDGTATPYYVASRAKDALELKAVTHQNTPDGVILYGVYGEKRTRWFWSASTVIPWAAMSTNSPPVW